MKNISILFVMLAILFISASCAKEEVIDADASFSLSFQRDGKKEAMAGTTFYVTPTGSGEFLTLFTGTEGYVWGEPGAKGVDFNKADSIGVTYAVNGKYMLSLVSTSTGDFGNEITREVKTVEITVVDDRNSFTLFNINGVNGVFSPNNEIGFSVPDVITDFNFAPIFALDSDLSKVYVNGIEQTSGITKNDFTQPQVYTVKSSLGNEQQYTVKFTTFISSSEKALTKFVLGSGGNGEIADIDEQNKTINLAVNYNTTISSVRLILESSYASTITLNEETYSDRKKYDLSESGLDAIKVIAQDKTEAIYKLNVTLDNPVKSFTFLGLVPAPQGIIDEVAKTISVDVLKGTDVTKLVSLWTGSSGKVTIGTKEQINGITENNFVEPITYTFYQGDVAGDQYVVTVNLK